MLQIRKSEERGHADHGWLDSHHSFSFADYYDPKHMGFRSLRVINEDWIAAGRGFGAHPHRDMEILTYVLEGKVAHKDSMGHEELLGPNEIQRMSAGTGVVHSEYNGSKTEPLHLLQIWIEPNKTGVKPTYEQIAFGAEEKHGAWKQLAGPDKAPGVAVIHQDAKLYVSELAAGAEISHDFKPGRHGWLQVVRGQVTVNGKELSGGDAVAVTGEPRIAIQALKQETEGEPQTSEVLLFDLA
jgi:redox-sensitive bicupin YhaK (pirin superfamily)